MLPLHRAVELILPYNECESDGSSGHDMRAGVRLDEERHDERANLFSGHQTTGSLTPGLHPVTPGQPYPLHRPALQRKRAFAPLGEAAVKKESKGRHGPQEVGEGQALKRTEISLVWPSPDSQADTASWCQKLSGRLC